MRWLIGIVVGGCSAFHPGGALDPDATPTDDANANADAPSGVLCLGAGEFQVCLQTPTQPFQVVGTTNTGIDTDANPPQCTFYPQPNNRPTLCVIAATAITIDANTLFVSGQHPLVLFASDSIEIGTGVDVGSHANGQATGAGFDSASCMAGVGAGSSTNGGDGGAGGSFGTKGGGGGGGGGTAIGDTAGAIIAADFLHGGCRGDDGGNGNGGVGGLGRQGGGAILLLAGGSIAIGGFVDASGGGGVGGQAPKGGGGGGGSGGMIAMSAPTITVTGTLVANGGGGGGGASSSSAGSTGRDPNQMMPLVAANGGTSGGASSGNGGAGAAGGTPAGNSGVVMEGAGGAGGGVGVIRILSGQSIGGTNSPIPVLN